MSAFWLAAAFLLPCVPLRAETDPFQISAAFFDGARPAGPSAGSFRLPPPPRPREDGAMLVRFFDGARQPLAADRQVLLRVFDGNHKEWVARYVRGPELAVQGLPIRDNFADNYRVVAWASGHKQAGVAALHLSRGQIQVLDLMLPPDPSAFDFSGASWESLRAQNPTLLNVLSRGMEGDEGQQRYERLLAEKPEAAACLLNIAAALDAIDFGHSSALEHVESVVWDETMRRDRFWAYARVELLEDVKAASSLFKRAPGENLFHKGAITSYKQVQFEGGNVQLTFHPTQRKTVRGTDCVLVEIDIDYYKDPLAHMLLEVLPHWGRHGKTDPKVAYQLRWMAGRRKGAPEFDPLYTLKPL